MKMFQSKYKTRIENKLKESEKDMVSIKSEMDNWPYHQRTSREYSIMSITKEAIQKRIDLLTELLK